MSKWVNGYLYPCKKLGDYPQCYVERVMKGKYKAVQISFFEAKGVSGYSITLTKRYAKLLLKRLNTALK